MSNPPTERDLLLAILAMDSYNRGYDRGIDKDKLKLADTGGIGNAIIVELELPQDWQSSGFFAIAYELSSGERVIAYRGTDKIPANPFNAAATGSDFWSYGIGIGQPFALSGGLTNQARLAIEFYRAVAGPEVDPFAANIITTGHSLGGGLAGYTAALYGKQATLFANMAFENAAVVTRAAAIVGSVVGLDTVVYGNGPINPLNRNGINAYAVSGELLSVVGNRLSQDTVVNPLYSNAGFPTNPVNLHSQALHVSLLWNRLHGNQDWVPAGKYLWDAYFNKDVALSVTGSTALKGTQDEVAVIDRAIAYSAIDEGTDEAKPFGDTAIHAMFNDAGDLGRAVSLGSALSSPIKNSLQELADILVQYAGKLALGDVEGDEIAKRGVLTNNGEVLVVDLSKATWAKGAGHTQILGRSALIARALSEVTVDPVLPGDRATGFTAPAPTLRSDLVTGLKWLYSGTAGYSAADPAGVVDLVVFKTTNGALNTALGARGNRGANDNNVQSQWIAA